MKIGDKGTRSARLRAVLASLVFFGLASFALISFALVNPTRITELDIQASLPEDFSPDPAVGEVLLHIGGCSDCHAASSPNDPSAGSLVGGMPLATDFGTFYPPNITPDVETGIGAWSDTDFVNAMVNGINPDGQHLYPSFPYTSYAKVSYADLLHLKSYLNSLPAEARRANPHELNFPFNLRIGVGAWKWMFHDREQWKPDPNETAEWNRGSYLVSGLGHCGSCHTPRNAFFAERSSKAFSGGPKMKKGGRPVPRIAGLSVSEILNGLDEWSGSIDEKSSMFLVTKAFSNHAPYEDSEAVAEYLSSLSEADLEN